ncbi:hypothetical protein [Bosea sp. PAMC 26642]|uniref:hypothetical protein n=1 Tax=Bosea sp. (strain PAMC 26642) TaxID=1792307 RepID=UPI001438BA92|nr:hypothetical protein [Bosea sp. PAMC 26642]
MTISVTPDIGARNARDATATPPIICTSEPEYEATSIVHIYWTLLHKRKRLELILQRIIAAPPPQARDRPAAPISAQGGLGEFRRCDYHRNACRTRAHADRHFR